jgi:hypothetical protein
VDVVASASHRKGLNQLVIAVFGDKLIHCSDRSGKFVAADRRIGLDFILPRLLSILPSFANPFGCFLGKFPCRSIRPCS